MCMRCILIVSLIRNAFDFYDFCPVALARIKLICYSSKNFQNDHEILSGDATYSAHHLHDYGGALLDLGMKHHITFEPIIAL